MKHLYPHVFGSGPTIVNPLRLRHYAKRMVLPCGFTTNGGMWTPSMPLEGYDPLLWLRADQGISTGGARDFEAASSAQATRASFAAVNLSTTDFSIVSNLHRETTGNMVIAAKYQDADNYWRWEITAGHKLHFIAVVAAVTLIEVTGTTSLDSLATWYHAAVVVDRDGAGTTEIYLNGVNDTAGVPTVSATSIDNTGAFFLGESGAGTLFYDGRLSRVGVLKADLLTQAEITWLYNLGRSRIHGSLGEVGTDGASLAPTWWANCNETATAGDVVDQVAAANLTTAVGLPAVDGPSSDIAPDTGSVGTAHGQLIGFADSETARSTDVPSAIGSGTSLVFDGVDDYVACGSIGSVTAISLHVKLLIDNQEILTLTNSTATAVTVASGVLTFGASLTASAITVDGVSVSAADAGATLNDNAWHLLAFSLTSISATDCRLGTDGSNFGQIMLDQVSVNAGTNIWTFDEETSLSVTDGDPIATWTSLEGSRHQFIQATASKRPVYRASAINGQAGIDFDGVDDLLAKASAFLTGTSGTVVVVYRLDAVPNSYQCLIASSDEATTARYLLLFARGNTSNNHIGYDQRNNDTDDILDGSTVVAVDTDYSATFGSNGTTLTARLNGASQTLNADGGANSGDWWDDTTAKDNVTLGATKSSIESSFMSGKICEVLVYPHNFGAESISKVAAYILARYGITF